jgi:uncharacterized protein DUF6597
MQYQTRAPRPELAPFVKCLWRLRGERDEIEPQPILPDGCFELVIHLGDPFVERSRPARDVAALAPSARVEIERRAGAIGTRQPRALLAATLTRTVLVAPGGEVDAIGVRFLPGRAYPFLAAAPVEVVDCVAPAIDVVARELVALASRLEPVATEELFGVVEGGLIARLSRSGHDPRYDRLVAALTDSDAPPSVSSLAESA